MDKTSKTTKDIEEIKRWVEERGGKPGTVKTGEETILRIFFSDQQNTEDVEEISWEQFSEIFKENNLTFLYQEQTKDGQISRFNKFIYEKSS